MTQLTDAEFSALPEYSASLPTWHPHNGDLIGCRKWRRRVKDGWMIGEACREGDTVRIEWTAWNPPLTEAVLDSRIPSCPGVYLICADGHPYYVGGSQDIRARLLQHIRRKTGPGMILAAGGTAHVLAVVPHRSLVSEREVTWAYRFRRHVGQTVYPHRAWELDA